VNALQNVLLRLRSSGLSKTTAVGIGARKVEGPASCVANMGLDAAAIGRAASGEPGAATGGVHPARRSIVTITETAS
jgi:hypothetical protein